ncbi:uncharacterized protein [Ptychodera flava]|uniref:uncharacterized protein n=1 Tax=Ptychodera flava TaxID=63121 RepID=UPI003969F8CF
MSAFNGHILCLIILPCIFSAGNATKDRRVSATLQTHRQDRRSVDAVHLGPYISREPNDITVLEMGSATLRCDIMKINSKVMVLKWMKEYSNGTVAGALTASQNGYKNNGRYKSRQSVDQYYGKFKLKIKNVQRTDAGWYFCSVYNKWLGQVILKSRRVKLDVLFPPDRNYPSCNSSDSTYRREGEILTTACISRGGSGWFRLLLQRNGKEINGTTFKNMDAEITHTWKLTADDTGANITCLLEGQAILNQRQCLIGPLVVQGPFDKESNSIDKYIWPSISVTVGIIAFLAATIFVRVTLSRKPKEKSLQERNLDTPSTSISLATLRVQEGERQNLSGQVSVSRTTHLEPDAVTRESASSAHAKHGYVNCHLYYNDMYSDYETISENGRCSESQGSEGYEYTYCDERQTDGNYQALMNPCLNVYTSPNL